MESSGGGAGVHGGCHLGGADVIPKISSKQRQQQQEEEEEAEPLVHCLPCAVHIRGCLLYIFRREPGNEKAAACKQMVQ